MESSCPRTSNDLSTTTVLAQAEPQTKNHSRARLQPQPPANPIRLVTPIWASAPGTPSTPSNRLAKEAHPRPPPAPPPHPHPPPPTGAPPPTPTPTTPGSGQHQKQPTCRDEGILMRHARSFLSARPHQPRAHGKPLGGMVGHADFHRLAACIDVAANDAQTR